MHRLLLLFAWLMLAALPAQALDVTQARAIAQGDTDSRIDALNAAVAAAAPGLDVYVQALLDDSVKLHEDRVLVFDGTDMKDLATDAVVEWPETAEDVINNNRMRGALQGALSLLNLSSTDLTVRREAINALAGSSMEEGQLPMLERALEAETEPGLKNVLGRLRASIMINSPDAARRLQAANLLGASGEASVRAMLQERLASESDPEVKAQLQKSIGTIDTRLAWGEFLGVLFTGASLGSILLLVALGLAITYGLMGVINMAHGELMMIGAYATYVVQGVFRQYLPGAFDWYLLAALPVAFMASALVGAAVERSVLRWLYGRPLETLLATWGISLVLMQAVRSLFGAQNVGVENPAWMSGGVEVMSNLTLPYNRIVIIAFAAAVLLGMAYLIGRTRLGLFVRGVTQNRPIASCMGVNTARIDTYAFALGSGIAGLAGCALSQVGNVGPDLGQGYIVDSFMVVVLGGVGQLAGTVYAALGLGVINKVLEGWTGAVLAKIAVLVFIIIFIQKRPQGLFAMKGRSAEA